MGGIFAGAAVAMRELTLFAAAGFLVLGANDIAIDLIWAARRLWRRADPVPADADPVPGLIAVFIPAWDEAAVIGAMLAHAFATLGSAQYSLYVGCYPNDPATIAAVRAVRDPRLRLVIGSAAGPTTKADCLNSLWRALCDDERRGGWRAKAVVLHDAEDVVHSAELALFDRLIERFDLVQLPVRPLVDRGSRWVAGHYIDEFCEAHGKELVVRAALGAGLPSAGVGCAFSRGALAAIAAMSGGVPFSADSLTEDYELGLKLHALGGRGAFVRLSGANGLIVTREYFPGTFAAAIGQKARWMTGIALAGWDRLGWSGGLAERWMRLRDRQSVLAALLLFAGYLALLLGGFLGLGYMLLGTAVPPLPAGLRLLLEVNSAMLCWRLAMRFGFVAQAYGWREGLRAIPRVFVGNWIAMFAARRAILHYLGLRRTGRARWDKTAHAFPAELPAE